MDIVFLNKKKKTTERNRKTILNIYFIPISYQSQILCLIGIYWIDKNENSYVE